MMNVKGSIPYTLDDVLVLVVANLAIREHHKSAAIL